MAFSFHGDQRLARNQRRRQPPRYDRAVPARNEGSQRLVRHDRGSLVGFDERRINNLINNNMQIKIEFNTDNVAFKDENGQFDKAGAINRIMKNINENILHFVANGNEPVRMRINDVNRKQVGILEITF